MAKKNEVVEKDPIANVEEALTKTELFVERNRMKIIYVFAGLVLIVLGYFAYERFISAPREENAMAAMFKAEFAFEKDSFSLALNGNANQSGFLQVIDEYGSTKSGNLAHLYAGVCYLRLGNYEEALAHLKQYSGKDIMFTSVALGAQGDALMELGKTEEAIEKYIKAAGKKENAFTSPMYLMKAGIAYEDLGQYSKALEVYNKVRRDFFQTNEGREIDKYIGRVEQQINTQ